MMPEKAQDTWHGASKPYPRDPGKINGQPEKPQMGQGPNRQRSTATVPQQLEGDACREAISFMTHTPDEASVLQKMKMTFQHRQGLVHDSQTTTDIFKTFPRFLDVKGLVSNAC